MKKVTLTLGLLFLFACSSEENLDRGRPSLGGRILLTDIPVPGDVNCLVVTAFDSVRTVSIAIAASNITSSLNLDGLPTGTVTIGVAAYDSICAVLTDSSIPTWLSDPKEQVVTLVEGVPFDFSITLRPNGVADAGLSWIPDINGVCIVLSSVAPPCGGPASTCASIPGCLVTDDSCGGTRTPCDQLMTQEQCLSSYRYDYPNMACQWVTLTTP
jgi:hypothetical protein